jgi:hypothetical protein
MIELLIVFMELVLMAVGKLLWAIAKSLALVLATAGYVSLTIVAYSFSKVAKLVVVFVAKQVDKSIKDALFVPALDEGFCEVGRG